MIITLTLHNIASTQTLTFLFDEKSLKANYSLVLVLKFNFFSSGSSFVTNMLLILCMCEEQMHMKSVQGGIRFVYRSYKSINIDLLT